MVKYLIVGGGIAGLYACLELVVNHKIVANDILIVEKSYRWGRRVHTLERDGITYECGAGRFSKNHRLLMELIVRYGLQNKMVQLSKKSEDRQIINGAIVIPNSLEEYFEKLLNIPTNKRELMSKTLFEVATEMFGIETATLMKSSHGFDDDFKIANAYDSIQLLKPMYYDDFYVLAGGLEQIIDGLVAELESLGVKMQLNIKCSGWTKKLDGSFNVNLTDFSGKTENSIDCDKLILALDKWGLLEFKELEHIHNLLDSVAVVPLTRIYARFPINNKTGFPWFHGIPKTTTNLPIRMFIPIHEKSGLCMISYSDGYYASQWQNDFIMSDLEHNLMKYIRQMFPEREIPEPIWIDKLHWANGVHSWRTFTNSYLLYSQIQNPFTNIYICGEAYSKWQGWIEGSLETAKEICQMIISEPSNKKNYTKEEVANSNNLTIIDGRVYNLFKMDWLSRHPGGEIIKKAVGIDATHMFQYIRHPPYAMNILEELYVGDLLN